MWGPVPTSHYLMLSALLFTIGTLGVLLRRNAIVILMAIELMLNAANLALVALGRQLGGLDGQVVVLFAITVAAAEVVVGLGIVVAIFRSKQSVSVDDVNILRW